jgi:hypothetical protein
MGRTNRYVAAGSRGLISKIPVIGRSWTAWEYPCVSSQPTESAHRNEPIAPFKRPGVGADGAYGGGSTKKGLFYCPMGIKATKMLDINPFI